MEARRLAVLCSHLRQIDLNHCPNRSISSHFSEVSTSNCVASSEDDNDHQSKLKSEKESDENDCVFCKIVRGESPAFKIFEDDVCLCILDLNPLNHGHSLIIPKSHYSSLETTPPSVVASMCSKIPFVSNAIMKATHCDAFNLLVNSGTAAGQVIFHTHVHIIPRKARDHLWTSKSFGRKPLKLDQQTTQLADRIREQLTLLNDNSEDGIMERLRKDVQIS